MFSRRRLRTRYKVCTNACCSTSVIQGEPGVMRPFGVPLHQTLHQVGPLDPSSEIGNKLRPLAYDAEACPFRALKGSREAARGWGVGYHFRGRGHRRAIAHPQNDKFSTQSTDLNSAMNNTVECGPKQRTLVCQRCGYAEEAGEMNAKEAAAVVQALRSHARGLQWCCMRTRCGGQLELR